MEIIHLNHMADGAQPLLERLVAELETGDTVLWLVPGGSNIPLVADVSRQIPAELTKNLLITLTDERYGNVGHANSNVIQLQTAGFDAKLGKFLPVLQPELTLEQTTDVFAETLQDLFTAADIIIGQFGMGPDGHIAGILPETTAVENPELAAGYKTETFTRITMTPEAIKHVDCAFVYAFGDAKREALDNLKTRDLSLTEQPAQILKQLPEVYVYNDQIGD